MNPFSYISETSTREAADIVSRAYAEVWGEEPNDNALVILLAQAHLESGWSRAGYRAAPRVGPIGRDECGVNAAGEKESRVLNNWGAVHRGNAPGGPTDYLGCDTSRGEPYGVYFRNHPTRFDGAVDWIKVATVNRGMSERPRSETALPAAKRGDVIGYVDAQGESGYFDVSRIAEYRQGMVQRAEVIAERLGVPWPSAKARAASEGVVFGVTLVGLVLGLASWRMRR